MSMTGNPGPARIVAEWKMDFHIHLAAIYNSLQFKHAY